MAHQAAEALKWRQGGNKNSNAGNAHIDPWTAALLQSKGAGKGQQTDQKKDGDDVVKRLSFLIEGCGDVRRSRSRRWDQDAEAEVVCLVSGHKGLQQLLFKDKIVPIWLPASTNYRKSMKIGRQLQRMMSLALSESQLERLVAVIDEFYDDISEVTVLSDLLSAEAEEREQQQHREQQHQQQQQHQQHVPDSDDEWQERQRARALEHRERARRWGHQRRLHERRVQPQDRQHDGRADRYDHDPDDRDARRPGHERFAMDTDGTATPTGSPHPSARSPMGRAVNSPRAESPGHAAPGPDDRRGGMARRPFSRPPALRARSASPRMGRTRSRERMPMRVETPILAAPKQRARRISPRRIHADYPPLGHGRGD